MSNPSEDRRIDREIHRAQASSDPFAGAMRATRMPMLITDPRQPDNPIVFVNDAFARLTGYTRAETLGRNCRFLQGPGTNVDDVDRLRQGIADRVPVEVELLNYRKDGSIFWNRVLVSPVFDGDDLTYFFASQLDVTRDRISGVAPDGSSQRELQRRIADLTAAEDRLHFTLKAGGLGTWTLDVANQRLVASALCKANFGRGPSDEFGYEDLKASIHPEDYSRWQQTLVTQEMSHRIKNTLATVQSIVSQSLRAQLPSNELREVVAQRIEALSGAHDILAEHDWDVAGLRQTVERALRPFNADGRIHCCGPDMEIRHAVSSALTLALHELATNAVKYGALSGDEGRVRVEWSLQDGSFVLTWDEIGGPHVTPPTRTGFGSRMIEKVLSATVEGSAKVEYRQQGVHFELRATSRALSGAAAG